MSKELENQGGGAAAEGVSQQTSEEKEAFVSRKASCLTVSDSKILYLICPFCKHFSLFSYGCSFFGFMRERAVSWRWHGLGVQRQAIV